MSDWAEALKEYMELRDSAGQLEGKDEHCSCDPENFYQCDNCKEHRYLLNEMGRLVTRWGDTWATILYKTQIYEPPQTLAQRTMELTAEDPDTP